MRVVRPILAYELAPRRVCALPVGAWQLLRLPTHGSAALRQAQFDHGIPDVAQFTSGVRHLPHMLH